MAESALKRINAEVAEELIKGRIYQMKVQYSGLIILMLIASIMGCSSNEGATGNLPSETNPEISSTEDSTTQEPKASDTKIERLEIYHFHGTQL
ncbi:MAG: hypothetical protein ACQESG_05700 [Nanobdellota archaeon]